MPSTHRPVCRPVLALTAAALVALPSCLGSPVFRSTGTLDAGLVSATITGPSDRPAIALGVRRAAQAPADPVVLLEGLRLVLVEGDEPRSFDLGFADFETLGADLIARCSHESGHEIEVTLRGRATGDGFDVAVEDRVAGRNTLLELSLRYSIEGDVSPEVWLPSAPARDGATTFAGDASWHLPLAYCRADRLAAALAVDVDQLAADRRLPQGLGFEPATRTLYHGLFAYDSEGPGERHRMHGGEAVAVQGETLRFAHALSLSADAEPTQGLLKAMEHVWDAQASWLLHHSVQPLDDRGVDSIARLVLVRAVRNRLGEMEGAMGRVAALRSDRARGTHGQRGVDAWFTRDRQLLHTARGLVAMNPADPSIARGIVNLLLSSPRSNGLFPAVVTFDPGTGHRQASPEAREKGERAGYHRTAHVGRTAYELVRIAENVADLRREIQEACRRTATFLVANQRSSGQLPAWFDLNYGAPAPDPESEPPLDTAPAAMFLAAFGRMANFEPGLQTCRRYLDWLDGLGYPALALDGVDVDGETPVDALSLGFAARAAVLLAGSSGTSADLARAHAWLDALIPFQNGNPRSDLPVPGHPGLFSRSLAEPRAPRADASVDQIATTGLLAEILLEGYLLTGAQRHLERGALALRAAQCGARRADLDPAWGPATGAVAALGAISSLGEAVVDLGGGFAVGIESLWLADPVVAPGQVRVEVLSDQPPSASALVTFRNAPDGATPWQVFDGETLLDRGVGAELTRGVRVPLREVADLEFRPPASIDARLPWWPRCRILGWQNGDRCWVEVREPGGRITQVPMDAANGRGFAFADHGTPFVAVDPRIGSVAEVRLAHERNGLVRYAPARRWLPLVLGDAACLDTGDDLEYHLVTRGTSRVVPFRSGRELARELVEGELTYSIQIPKEATRVRIDAVLTGAARISTASQTLHVDEVDSAAIRSVQIDLSDRRLWRNEVLALTFENASPSGQPLTLAKVLYRTEGEGAAAVATEPGPAGNTPSAALRILVVPVQLADAPLKRSPDALEQVFFGDAAYRVTPEPESRRTTGSVASLVANLSGGRTACTGEVRETLPLAELAAELALRPDAGLEQVATEVALLDAVVDEDWDLIVVVHGRHAQWGSSESNVLAAEPGRPAFVFLPDNLADGSILSAGTALATMLHAAHDIARIRGGDHGAFGALTLTAQADGHVPAGLLGEDLAAAGWADPIRVPEDDEPVDIPNLYEDRAYLTFETTGLTGRGQLIAEEHSTGAAEPGLQAAGALLYWRRDARHAPLIIRADGRRARPERLRLSPSASMLETPFAPATAEGDLFRGPITLDGDTRPTLATPEGDDLWHVDGLHMVGERRSGAVDFRARDLEDGLWTWTSNDAPLRLGEGSVPTGGVWRTQDVLTMSPTALETRSIRGVFEQPLPEAPHRLLCELSLADPTGSVRVSAGIGSDTLFDIVVDAREPDVTLEFDLPSAAQGRLWVEVVDADDATPNTLSIPLLRLVPRQTALDRITPGQILPPTAPAVDGIWRSAVAELPVVTDGRASWRGPLVVERGSKTLRLLAHRLRGGPGEPVKLTLTLRGTEGKFVHRILDREPLAADPGAPGLVLLAELPEGTPDVVFAELVATGPNGATVAVQALEVLR